MFQDYWKSGFQTALHSLFEYKIVMLAAATVQLKSIKKVPWEKKTFYISAPFSPVIICEFEIYVLIKCCVCIHPSLLLTWFGRKEIRLWQGRDDGLIFLWMELINAMQIAIRGAYLHLTGR